MVKMSIKVPLCLFVCVLADQCSGPQKRKMVAPTDPFYCRAGEGEGGHVERWRERDEESRVRDMGRVR